MKFPKEEDYVKVKHHRYKIHPTENISIRLRDGPKSSRTQYEVQNEIQTRKKQKVVKNANIELLDKTYPTNKQPINQQPTFKPPNSPGSKRNNWLEFDKGKLLLEMSIYY